MVLSASIEVSGEVPLTLRASASAGATADSSKSSPAGRGTRSETLGTDRCRCYLGRVEKRLAPNEATRTKVRDAVSCWLPIVVSLVILFLTLKPVYDTARMVSLREVFVTNTKWLGRAVAAYCADNDDRFPLVMDSALAMKPAIDRHLIGLTGRDDQALYESGNPASREILANWHLAGRARSSVGRPEGTALFYDAVAWPGGKREVAMLGGGFSFLPGAEVEGVMRDEGGVFSAK